MSTTRKSIKGKFILKLGLHAVLLGVFTMVFFIFLIWIGMFGKLPTPEELARIENHTASEVYTADGELMGRYFLENRLRTSAEDISPHVLNALVATEDARFFEHKGIDYIGLGRVILKTVILGNMSQGGGSTISQQLAKNLYPRKGRSVFSMAISKVKEAITAARIEKVYSKEQVLILYLNTVPFGEDIYGIETAAQRFFSIGASELNPPRAATLIGMLAANTAYSPRLHPERSMKRRNTVLKRMLEQGDIGQTEYEKWKDEAIKLRYKRIDHNTGIAPYFRGVLKKDIEEILKREHNDTISLFTDGLIIYTSIDSRLQELAANALVRHMDRLQEELNSQWEGLEVFEGAKQLTDSLLQAKMTLHSGFLAIDPHNGDILAWVGGRDHSLYQYDHVTSKRQVGSTFKPIVYAAALEKGIKPCDFYSNERRVYEEYSNWSPGNSHGEYEGYYSVKGALAHSVNTVSAEIIMETGPGRVVQLAKEMGIESDIPELPSIALGTADISLKEMVTAYSSFINNGYPVRPSGLVRIEDKRGNELYSSKKENDGKLRAISNETASLMTYMLKEVADSGTARSLRSVYRLKSELGGKTGTTQNGADGWFIGFTPNLLAGCWVGADDPRVHFRKGSMGQGAYMALPVFARFVQGMERSSAHRQYIAGSFPLLQSHQLRKLDCVNWSDKDPDMGFFDKLFINRARKDSLRRKKEAERDSLRLEREKNMSDQEKKIRKSIRNIFGRKRK